MYFGCGLISRETAERVASSMFSFNASVRIVSIMLHLTVMMTFGTAYPILTIIVGVSIILDYYLWSSYIGKALPSMDESSHLEYMAALCKSFRSQGDVSEEFGTAGGTTFIHNYTVGRSINNSIPSLSPSPSPSPSSSSSPTPSRLSLIGQSCVDCWIAPSICRSYVVIGITIFWGLLFVDIIGSELAGLMTLLATFVTFPLFTLSVYYYLKHKRQGRQAFKKL